MSDLPDVHFGRIKKCFKHLLLSQMLGLLERLVWRSSKAIFAGMGPYVIMLSYLLIEISLQLLDSVIDFLGERYLLELFLDGAMETFANAISLGMRSFVDDLLVWNHSETTFGILLDLSGISD